MTKYPFGRLVDVPYNRFALEDFIEVFHPMSSANINAPSTSTRGKFHVVWMIAHHKGSAKIEAVVFGSPIQEIWFRLNAHATVSTLVRADVGFQNLRSHLRQSGNHVRVNTLYVVNAYHPFGNARLVCYDEKKELILESFQRVDGIWKEDDLRWATQVPSIFNQRPIPIQKHGWPQLNTVRAGCRGFEVSSEKSTVLAVHCRHPRSL